MPLNAEAGHSRRVACSQVGSGVSATIIHSAIAGRARLRHLGFVARDDRLTAANAMLEEEPGFVSVRSNALTGSVLVTYRHPLTLRRITSVIDAAASDRRLARRKSRCGRRLSLSAAAAASPVVEAAQAWHTVRIADTLERLGSHVDQGLNTGTVAARLGRGTYFLDAVFKKSIEEQALYLLLTGTTLERVRLPVAPHSGAWFHPKSVSGAVSRICP